MLITMRSCPRKRASITTASGIWVPSISAVTRVFYALCAGTTHGSGGARSSLSIACAAPSILVGRYGGVTAALSAFRRPLPRRLVGGGKPPPAPRRGGG